MEANLALERQFLERFDILRDLSEQITSIVEPTSGK